MSSQQKSQRDRKRQHPLAHGYSGYDVIDQLGGCSKISLVVAVVAATIVTAKQTGLLALLTDVQGLQQWISGLGATGYLVFIGLFVFSCV